MITADATEVTLAHDALLREWGTLRQWIDENREALRILQALSRDARRYFDTGQNADDLWHGTLLRRALQLQATGQLQLSAAEAEYLARSAKDATHHQSLLEQQQRRTEDKDLAVGGRLRSIAIVLFISIALASSVVARRFDLHRTHQFGMMQTGGLAVAGAVLIYLLRNRLAPSRINRQFMGLCYSSLLPLFLNHFIGWKLDLPLSSCKTINNDIFLMLTLAAMINVDRKVWKIAMVLIIAIFAGVFWPEWGSLIFGLTTAIAGSFLLFLFRAETNRMKALPEGAEPSDEGLI
jgi:hypothetical protein